MARSQRQRSKVTLRVNELDCAEEAGQLRRLLESTAGVEQLDFDVLNGRMTVTFDAGLLSTSNIIDQVASIGMTADLPGTTENSPEPQSTSHVRTWLTTAAGCCVGAGLVSHVVLSEGVTAPEISRAFYSGSIALGLWFVVPKAWTSLRRMQADMNVLMCAAVVGAVCLGEWLEAAVVTFLFQVSLLLEHWSMQRARREVRALLDLTPPTATVISADCGHEHEQLLSDIQPGAIVIVRPTERIPVDGRIVQGASSVNQAPVTGESFPIDKTIGDEVFAGTINEQGLLKIEAARAANDSTAARIIRLVHEAYASRAPAEQFVEQFARYYTPAMMAASLLIAIVPPIMSDVGWSTSIYNALVLLVIACPCALVISTPVSIVSALTCAARNGVLVKGGRYLEAAGRVRAMAIDKTGTLTVGLPAVREVRPLNGHSRAELLERAASLESRSTHPVAAAVCRCAEAEGHAAATVDDFQILSGRGAEGSINGRAYWIGSRRLMSERMPHADEAARQCEQLQSAGTSVAVIGSVDHVCGLIAVADQVRGEAKDFIAELRRVGVKHIKMLTGDHQTTARRIAEDIGVEDWRAEALPEDKLTEVEAMRRNLGTVAMLGDGVNDSPALAAADVGIVMGAVGTDAAIEAADIALMSDDLSKVPWLIQLGRRTLSTIQANVGFALGLKLLFVALAAAGWTSLWMAIAADTGASLLVVFNSLRLLRQSH